MVESLAVSTTSETLPATDPDMSNTKPATIITNTIKPPSKRIISALIWAFSSINITSTFCFIKLSSASCLVYVISYFEYIITRV